MGQLIAETTGMLNAPTAAIIANNRDELITYVNRFMNQVYIGWGNNIFITCTLPCNTTKNYKTAKDVPTESDECLCGTLKYKHYFILYTDLEKGN